MHILYFLYNNIMYLKMYYVWAIINNLEIYMQKKKMYVIEKF